MFRYVNKLFLKSVLSCFVIVFFSGTFENINAVTPTALAAPKTDSIIEETFFIESSDATVGYAVAVDEAGNVFMAGTSKTQWGSPVNQHSGGAGDCFVAKLHADGALQWNTFLGGRLSDGCRAIALDEKGNVYVTGESSSNWAKPLKPFNGGSSDCFIAKLNADGALQWNTFLGSAFYDGGYAIAVDKTENIFVTGNSVGSWGSPRVPHSKRNNDAFAAKLDRKGTLHWNTFWGGDDFDGGYAIALDGDGNVYIAGESGAGWGSPVNDYIRGYLGDYDAVVTKLDSKGDLQWHTFMGGIGSDYGRGIALDRKGYIYVTGNSNVSWGQPIAPHQGGYDAFAARLDEKGFLQWHTFMGGKGADYCRAISLDLTDSLLLAGQSSTSWGAPVNEFSSEKDAYVAKLSSNGYLDWNTFLGGTGSDFGRSITTDRVGNIYLGGESSSPWGMSAGNFQARTNAFVANLNNAGVIRWNSFLGTK